LHLLGGESGRALPLEPPPKLRLERPDRRGGIARSLEEGRKRVDVLAPRRRQRPLEGLGRPEPPPPRPDQHERREDEAAEGEPPRGGNRAEAARPAVAVDALHKRDRAAGRPGELEAEQSVVGVCEEPVLERRGVGEERDPAAPDRRDDEELPPAGAEGGPGVARARPGAWACRFDAAHACGFRHLRARAGEPGPRARPRRWPPEDGVEPPRLLGAARDEAASRVEEPAER